MERDSSPEVVITGERLRSKARKTNAAALSVNSRSSEMLVFDDDFKPLYPDLHESRKSGSGQTRRNSLGARLEVAKQTMDEDEQSMRGLGPIQDSSATAIIDSRVREFKEKIAEAAMCLELVPTDAEFHKLQAFAAAIAKQWADKEGRKHKQREAKQAKLKRKLDQAERGVETALHAQEKAKRMLLEFEKS